MRIRLICVGKLKVKYLRSASAEYTKRLSSYGRLEIIEVRDERDDDPDSLKKEANAITRYIRDGDYVIALAIEGETMDSISFSQKLRELGVRGKPDVTFIIGGSGGLDDMILQKADLLLSFSRMTFPHQLMRIILLEQIYRAYKIMKGEKYHK